MSDISTPSQEAPPDPTAQREALLRDRSFVDRWNAGDPEALKQLDAVSRAAIARDPDGDKPRPPNADGLNELLSRDQARQLAQASVDAGQDPAVVLEALKDSDPNWRPDTRPQAERQWAQDHEVGHPERYRIDGMDRHFGGDLASEREAFGEVVRTFVAGVGLDRGAGSEIASEIVKTAAELRGQRPEVRAQYRQQQAAMLGEKGSALVADATKALSGVNPGVLDLLHKSGALDNANVVVALAHMAQARAARGGQQ